MKLNIETVDTQATLASLKKVYGNEKVILVKTYDKCADYEITSPFNEPRVWPIEGLLELPRFGISIEKIRIW